MEGGWQSLPPEDMGHGRIGALHPQPLVAMCACHLLQLTESTLQVSKLSSKAVDRQQVSIGA
jgi:hypothetical protein